MAYPVSASSFPKNYPKPETEILSQSSAPHYHHHHPTVTTEASASTSTSANPNSDIFINLASDSKKAFASYLYRRLLSHGLSVFLDQQELQDGENLSSQIEHAIRTASVHVAIFSPKYAESRWCLNELVLMLQSSATIIPVFYHIKPWELRWTRGGTGLYAQALVGLENIKNLQGEPRYESTTVENWREALSRVADISGFELEAYDGDEGELLDVVVESVLKRVKKPLLTIAQYPTGLDEKLADFEMTVFSQQHSRRSQVMGIVGLGGTGKTTLAKAFFNSNRSNYSRSCFLFDIRENARTRSLLSLQRELLKGLTGMDDQIDSIHEGILMIRKLLSSSNVLVILDDVDDVSQVDVFWPLQTVLHSDSLMLITSRDKYVLLSSGVEESAIYKLTGLNKRHSAELFCFFAFNQRHPLPGFESLVDEFISACNGLPLSLKVFGAFVNGTDKSYWKDQLNRLQIILPDEIQQRLKVSYDALNIEEQQMFLDIACFFVGERSDMAIRIWDGSGWNGSLGFQNLQNRCLVEVDNLNQIQMHDHLKDLGRQIAQAGLPRRLWHRTDIDDLLQQSQVITEVRGIRMLSDDDGSEMPFYKKWSLEVFGSRAMKLYNKHSRSMDFKKLQLVDTEGGLLMKILSRMESPNLKWLRWFKYPHSSLPSWIPTRNLRVLEVRGNKLESLWQAESEAPLHLRELDIDSPLAKLPKSIGRLKHLEQIVLKNCNLKNLPDECCLVRSLKRLELRNCSKLKSLPDSFGCLINLEYIHLSDSPHLEMLPNSFGNLIRLNYLNLSRCCNLTISSKTLGNISMLESIDLSYCTKIEELPLQLAHQRSLKLLDLKGTNLKEFPSAVGALSELEVLELGSPLLDRLPPSVGDLGNLKELTLSGMQLRCLPKSVRLLTKLTELKVENCNALVEVGTLPSALIKLVLTDCLKLRKILELYGLAELQMLDITGCKELEELSSVETLVSLEELRASTCVKLKSIHGLGGLTKLRKLDIRGCKEVEELPSIESLVALEELNVSYCEKLHTIRGLAQLTTLQILDIRGCKELEELPSFETLKSLVVLQASKCVKLNSIQGLAQLTQLRELDVSGCSNLQELPGLEHLWSLKVPLC